MTDDPYKYFRIEASEIVDDLAKGILDLEKGVDPAGVVSRLLRQAHTLKGAARVVRQVAIAEQAHAIETELAAIREAGGAARETTSRVLLLLDAIRSTVGSLAAPAETRGAGDAAPSEPSGPARDMAQALRPDPADLEALTAGVANVRAQVEAAGVALSRVTRIRHMVDLLDQQLDARRSRDSHDGSAAWGDRFSAVLDELRREVRALERGAGAGLDQADRDLRHVADAAARLRLAPAGAMFPFLERAARDVAQALGKDVVFEAEGGDVRVESGVLAAIQGALLQVVRNAVAHGIEPSASARASAGKDPRGHVALTVSRRGASLSFLCADDGRGVDFDAVGARLVKSGVPAHQIAGLGRRGLLDALLRSGISTSGTVTELAGRGIGLDVVREAAERLGGTATMQSEPGRGTTVELLVPASLSSFEALIVEAGGATVAVPIDAVRGMRCVPEEELVTTGGAPSMAIDGRMLAVTPLARLIGTGEGAPQSQAVSVFILAAGDRDAAFAVDRVVGSGRLIMQPLPDGAPASPIIAGASLDAGGRPRLVLDPAQLIDTANGLDAVPPAPVTGPVSVLVVDDSLTTRMLEQSILESAGYRVVLASSAEEGLEKARAERFAVFLVDVEMPGMDGFTFVERTRADEALRDVPAILITSRGSTEDRERGRAAGAAGYIVKGEFDQVALLDRIRSLAS